MRVIWMIVYSDCWKVWSWIWGEAGLAVCWPALARFGGLHLGEHCGGAVIQPYLSRPISFSFELLIGEVLSWGIFDFVWFNTLIKGIERTPLNTGFECPLSLNSRGKIRRLQHHDLLDALISFYRFTSVSVDCPSISYIICVVKKKIGLPLASKNSKLAMILAGSIQDRSLRVSKYSNLTFLP